MWKTPSPPIYLLFATTRAQKTAAMLQKSLIPRSELESFNVQFTHMFGLSELSSTTRKTKGPLGRDEGGSAATEEDQQRDDAAALPEELEFKPSVASKTAALFSR